MGHGLKDVTDAALTYGPASRRETIRPRFVARVFWICLALALTACGIKLFGHWAGHSIAMGGHSDDTSPREIVLGNNVLDVPANMIRFEAARRSGVAARLDLYMRWPQMDGYSDGSRDDFNHRDGSRRILFVSLEERIMSRDMSGRFEPIYSSLIVRPGRQAPGGLTAYPFSAQSGYVDEMLIVGDEGSSDPFVARCLSGDAARQTLAPCERDIHFGDGLNLVYRMPAELAGSWREIDEAVRAKVTSFLRGED